MEKYDAEKQTQLNDEFGQTGKLHFKSPIQKEIETQRYKQDCRKRALEMAQYTTRDMGQWLEKNELKVFERSTGKDKTEVIVMPSELVKSELLLPLADKYYNWLISIPNQ